MIMIPVLINAPYVIKNVSMSTGMMYILMMAQSMSWNVTHVNISGSKLTNLRLSVGVTNVMLGYQLVQSVTEMKSIINKKYHQ